MKCPILIAAFACFIGNRTAAQPCTPLGNQTSYGTGNVWIGYVYDNTNFTNYRGFVNQGSSGNPNFDQSFGGDNVSYPTNGCPVQTETFSVRYLLTRNFTNATYDITVGADDGYRLSLDGGSTWVINQWFDQGYSATSYSVSLNGTYNMVLEYYENGGGNRVSFNLVTSCAGSENPSIYGHSDVWNGYVYDGTNFNAYKGMVHQGSLGNINFDQNFGGSNTAYATSGCSVQTETYSVRYRLNKSFASGSYTFIVGGDDGYRLSFDGGLTWVINRWVDQSYNTTSYTTNLSGNYNMVLEFYEQGGDNRISMVMQANIILKVDLLSFRARESADQNINLDWTVSADSDPGQFVIERSNDGVVFVPIKTIAGSQAIGGSSAKRYEHVDHPSIFQTLYYRLLMTDTRGVNKYSNIVSVRHITVQGSHLIFPTQIQDGTLFLKTGSQLKEGVLRISDLAGKTVFQQKMGVVEKGVLSQFSLSGNRISSGIYIAVLMDQGRQVANQKVIIR